MIRFMHQTLCLSLLAIAFSGTAAYATDYTDPKHLTLTTSGLAHEASIKVKKYLSGQLESAGAVLEDDREHAVVPPSGIAIQWEEVSNADGVLRKTRASHELSVLNLDAREVEVQIVALGDLGTMQSKTAGPSKKFLLKGKAHQNLSVALDPQKMKHLQYSGMILVHVSACPAAKDAGPNCVTAVSDPLYFHPETDEKSIVFCRETALAEQFNSGDFRSQTGRQEPGTLRVMGGEPLLDLPMPEELTLQLRETERDEQPQDPLLGAPVPTPGGPASATEKEDLGR